MIKLESLLNESIKVLSSSMQATRQEANRAIGQYFVFNNKLWTDYLINLFKAYNVPKAEEKARSYIFTASRELLTKSRSIPKNRLKELKANRKEMARKLGEKSSDVMVVASYNTVQKMKTDLGAKINRELKIPTKHITGQVSKDSSLDEFMGIQIGHGEYGIPISAAKVLQVERSLKRIEKSNPEDFRTLSEGLQRYKETVGMDASVIAEQVVTTKGKFKKSFNFVISAQSTSGNAIDSKVEQKALNELNKYFKKHKDDLMRIKASPSGFEALEKIILGALKENVKSKYIKLSTALKPAKNVKTRTKKSKKSKTTLSDTIKVTAGRLVDRFRIPKAKRSSVNLRKLIPQLNMRLHDQIKSNMGSPALNYRTGRFARSARVIDIKQLSKGSAEIDYTYMKDPYNLFEFPEGSPRLATPARDPRDIIGKSVREIASEIMTQKYYVKRI